MVVNHSRVEDMQEVKKLGFQPCKTAIPLPEDAIAVFCRRWKIDELYLFGSILRDDFHADSDVDTMVHFSTDSQWSLFDLVEMKADLESAFARKVDIMTKKSVEDSTNWIRRQEILSSARLFYVTR
ncbi:MAG: nucleotidyltransferase domain-containing protein [Cyanobacteria bacterium J06627_28]